MTVLVGYTNNGDDNDADDDDVAKKMKVCLTSQKIMVVVVTNAVTIATMLLTINKCTGDNGDDGW